MFKSRQRVDQERAALYDALMAKYQKMVAERSPEAPAMYPDGTPFPAAEHMMALSHAMAVVATLDHPDYEAIGHRLGWMLNTFPNVSSIEPDITTTQMVYETRMWFQKIGLHELFRIVSDAGSALARYWEQTGALARSVEPFTREPNEGT